MFEILLGIATIALMAKIADSENLSAVTWGGLTLLLLIPAMFIPIPFARVLIAGAAVFILMTIYRARKGD